MALPTGALDTYCAAIFDNIGMRSLSQFKAEWQEEIKTYAVTVKKYAVSVYAATLAAGRITQAQYDELVSRTPVAEASAEAESTESETTTEE